jgi:predicted RNase H-like HicB family nuclease
MSQLQVPSAIPDGATRNQFMAIIERRDGNHVAHCPEIPGVEGVGRTKMAALVDLREAVARMLAERRDQAVREASAGAVFDLITIV